MNTFTQAKGLYRALLTAMASAMIAASGSAGAATATNTLGVNGAVVNSCAVTSTAAIAFGNYDPAVTNLSANLDQQGTVTVQCTTGAGYTIFLSEGSGTGATCSAATPVRAMSDGASHELSYSLYQDSNRTTQWGCDAANDFEGEGTGNAEAINVYGRVPGGQNQPKGSYSDTLTVTVTYTP
ncbi:MAG: spore coat U domain-containing protein [Methylotetracoccus sp.]